MDDKAPKSSEESLLLSVGLLFSGYFTREPAEDLRTISRYFEHLAQRIDYRRRKVTIPNELLGYFESVCLLLSDRLRSYPEPVQKQVEEILREERLARTFAILAALPDDGINSPRHSLVEAFAEGLSAAGASILAAFAKTASDRDRREIKSTDLFDAKIALNRLSQIVRYASTIQLTDHDVGFEEFSDHYDPRLIEKPKLLALVNLLKTQVGELEDENVRSRLIQRIDTLEDEIRKPRPRWGHIIAGFFVIFSFVADVKTIAPHIYDSVYKTAEIILATLHRDAAMAHQHKAPMLPEQPPADPVAILTEPIKIRQKPE